MSPPYDGTYQEYTKDGFGAARQIASKVTAEASSLTVELGVDNDPDGRVLKVYDDIRKESHTSSSREPFFYRGEPECYGKVASNLYRNYRDRGFIGDETDDKEARVILGLAQDAVLKGAEEYIPDTKWQHLLSDVQHFGGHNNLIDFTYDINVALFFACNKSEYKDGRIVMLRKKDCDRDDIISFDAPARAASTNRPFAQKSVFILPWRGYVEPYAQITISSDLKGRILHHLQRFYGVSEKYIYGDIHGFIQGYNDPTLRLLEYKEKGKCCLKKRDFSFAIEEFSKAKELLPDRLRNYDPYEETFELESLWEEICAEFYLLGAMAYLGTGSYDKAEDNLHRAQERKDREQSNNLFCRLFCEYHMSIQDLESRCGTLPESIRSLLNSPSKPV